MLATLSGRICAIFIDFPFLELETTFLEANQLGRVLRR